MLDSRQLTLFQRRIVALLMWSVLCVGGTAWYSSAIVHMQHDALADTQALLERRDAGEMRAQRRWRKDRILFLRSKGSALLGDTSISTAEKAIPAANIERLMAVEYDALAQARTEIRPSKDDHLEAATYVVGRRGALPLNATPTGQLDKQAVSLAFADEADLNRLLAIARGRSAEQSQRDKRNEQAFLIHELARWKARE